MKKKNSGGIALEYILVSSFAIIASTIMLGFFSNIVKNKVKEFTAKLGIDHIELQFADFISPQDS